MQDTPKDPSGTPGLWDLVTLGSILVGCIVGGLVVGLLVDHAAGTSPTGVIVGIVIGLAAAGIAMYVRMRRFLNNS